MVRAPDGFLTAPSSAPAATIARAYLASHARPLRHERRGDLPLVQTRDCVDAGGLHQVSLAQQLDGIPVFQGGVKVNVDAHGRVVSVLGSPLRATGADAPPTISGGEALGIALRRRRRLAAAAAGPRRRRRRRTRRFA